MHDILKAEISDHLSISFVHFSFSREILLTSADGRQFALSGAQAAVCLLASQQAALQVATVAEVLWPDMCGSERMNAYRKCVRLIEGAVGLRLFMPGVMHKFFAYVTHSVDVAVLDEYLLKSASSSVDSTRSLENSAISLKTMSVIDCLLRQQKSDESYFA